MSSPDRIAAWAERLDHATLAATPIAPLGEACATVEDAYAIQRAVIARRLARGERQIGVKMGFTSRAKIQQMGVGDPIWGRLTDGMLLEEGAPTAAARYIHPRAEPELAFLLARPLAGAVTPLQAQAAVEAIAPAIELLDSRYRDFRFSHHDVVADNGSSAGFLTGAWHSPKGDFSNLGLMLRIDGRPVHYGSTAAILGHPLRSLVAAARFAGVASQPLQAGWVVLAGGATPAEPVRRGAHVALEMERLGRCEFWMGA